MFKSNYNTPFVTEPFNEKKKQCKNIKSNCKDCGIILQNPDAKNKIYKYELTVITNNDQYYGKRRTKMCFWYLYCRIANKSLNIHTLICSI